MAINIVTLRVNKDGSIANQTALSNGIESVNLIDKKGGRFEIRFAPDTFSVTPVVLVTQNFSGDATDDNWNNFGSNGGDARDHVNILNPSIDSVEVITIAIETPSPRNFNLIAIGQTNKVLVNNPVLNIAWGFVYNGALVKWQSNKVESIALIKKGVTVINFTPGTFQRGYAPAIVMSNLVDANISEGDAYGVQVAADAGSTKILTGHQSTGGKPAERDFFFLAVTCQGGRPDDTRDTTSELVEVPPFFKGLAAQGINLPFGVKTEKKELNFSLSSTNPVPTEITYQATPNLISLETTFIWRAWPIVFISGYQSNELDIIGNLYTSILDESFNTNNMLYKFGAGSGDHKSGEPIGVSIFIIGFA